VIDWPETSSPMTVASIRQKYDPATFRIAEHRYAPSTSFPGRTRAATWFVLAGSCRVTSGEDVLVTAGQVVEMDAGEYTMTVTGDSELHLVQVWDLRPFMD
jgi:mannose-6-phosphate isomerase-like protein (cupin superfamily)